MRFEIALIIFLGVIIQALSFLLGFSLGEKNAQKTIDKRAEEMAKRFLEQINK